MAFNMNHLELQPQLGSQPAKGIPPRKKSSKGYLAIAALALILGSGYAMTALFDATSSDHVPASTKSRLATEFAQAKPFALTPVPAGEVDIALDSMKLSADQRQALKSSLTFRLVDADATSSLAWIELWDFAAQDGDIVHISSAGYEVDYPILNVPNKLAIPVDATLSVTIRGVHDGGGGITLGLRSGAAGISMPVIEPGQTLIVPVTF
ncbi:hypothetical protein PSGK_10155 [Pseudomonas solani]|uniref:hypothetical protein n=1 Tax=Pseudomonas solani TaxID=2731552 RepID=UPI0035BE6B1D